jgi:hypothetical protein
MFSYAIVFRGEGLMADIDMGLDNFDVGMKRSGLDGSPVGLIQSCPILIL